MPHDGRKRASDFDLRIFETFDGYAHGKISATSCGKRGNTPPVSPGR